MSESIAQVSEILGGLSEETEVADTESEQVQAVADILTDEPEREQEAAPDGDVEAEEEAPGVDYSLDVPMTDGTKVKLGELKDHYQQYQSKLLEFSERENALMSKYQQVQDMAQYAQNIPPEKLQEIQQHQRQYLEQQHNLMLEAMPEFKDANTFKTAKDSIFAMAKEYGVEDVIGQVTDHRIVKMLRDYAQLREGIRAAKGAVKPIRSTEPKGQKAPAGKPDAFAQAAARAKETGHPRDQIAAVSALFRS